MSMKKEKKVLPEIKVGILNPLTGSQGYIRIIRNNPIDVPFQIQKPNMETAVVTNTNNNTILELKQIRSDFVSKFGWQTIDLQDIPYIIVGDIKFVSVRIINDKIFAGMHKFSEEVYECLRVKCYSLTESETNLFNEINFKHCDGYFGKLLFIEGKDRKISMEDLLQTYNFLKFCTRIMFSLANNLYNDICEETCGFVQINMENYVPYVVRGREKFVPLFYFEGDCSQLKNKFDKTTKWEMTYLRFLFKLQNLKREFLELSFCEIVNFYDMKPYFSPKTSFILRWPISDYNWMKEKSS